MAHTLSAGDFNFRCNLQIHTARSEMPHMIRGIGGIFVYAQDPIALVAWYERNLGIRFAYEEEERSYYHDFVLPLDRAYGRVEREVLAIRQAELHIDVVMPFVINLRVQDLPQLTERLREQGITIEREKTYDYGHFAWLKDAAGNALELFEPAA